MTHGKSNGPLDILPPVEIRRIVVSSYRRIVSNFAACSESYDELDVTDGIISFFERHGTSSVSFVRERINMLDLVWTSRHLQMACVKKVH